jgi:hypothetical protein
LFGQMSFCAASFNISPSKAASSMAEFPPCPVRGLNCDGF